MISVARRVVRDCFAGHEREPVVLAWSSYADEWFGALAKAFGEAGAVPVSKRYTRADLTAALAAGGPPAAAALLTPPPTATGKARLVVVHYAEDDNDPERLQEGAAGLAEAQRLAFDNFAALIAADVVAVLLTWPRPDPHVIGGQALDGTDVLAQARAALDIDYAALRRRNRRLRGRLRGARTVHLSCARGTDLTLRVDGRRWLCDEGRLPAVRGRPRLVDERYFQLPTGEVYIAVRERSAEGRFCFERQGGFYEVEVAGGVARGLRAIGGRATADAAARLADGFGVGSEPVAELGIGTNPGATIHSPGSITEKALGTVHIALGSNERFGGESCGDRHCDIVLAAPDVDVDGQPLLRAGHAVAPLSLD